MHFKEEMSDLKLSFSVICTTNLLNPVALSLFPFLGSGDAFQWSSCIFTGLQYTVSEVTICLFHVKNAVVEQKYF